MTVAEMQRCRDCHREFPHDEEADYCPSCIYSNTGDLAAADAVVLAQPRRYLGVKPRPLIAAWIIEYRHFIETNPDSELSPTLARCIADARLALRQRRAVDRLTGWTRAKAHAVYGDFSCTPHSVAGRRSA